MQFNEHRVHNTLQKQRPDGWLQLAHLAGQLAVQHGHRVDDLKILTITPLPEKVADKSGARRNLQAVLRGRIRARNEALHIYLGAGAAGFEYPKADFSKTALPQRLREAEATGKMLRYFVQAGQLLVVAQQLQQVTCLAQEARNRAAVKLEAAHRHLFVHDPLRPRPLPLSPIAVLTLVGLEVPGINRPSQERIQLALHPRLTSG